MKKINKVEIDNEIIHLKKGILGWNVIHPIKNDDGTINWKNLFAGGGWLKLLLVAVFCTLLILTIFEYVESLKYCASVINRFSNFTITIP